MNMDLNFTQSGNAWIAEFEATGDFNLHIEKPSDGYILISQRGVSSGEYDSVNDVEAFGKVYDCDFSALVYPKYLKVVLSEQPSVAVVTFNA